MKLDRYEFEFGDDLTKFEFVSEGKKGRVNKIVHFQQSISPGIYNLAFGDKDPATENIDDLVVTNNGDTEKILATVAVAVYRFTERFPGALIYATGSTNARTRLYRMLINKYFDIALESFTIFGKFQDQWEKYEKNKNYQAFAAQRKFSKFDI
jgi:hypothetical protein